MKIKFENNVYLQKSIRTFLQNDYSYSNIYNYILQAIFIL